MSSIFFKINWLYVHNYKSSSHPDVKPSVSRSVYSFTYLLFFIWQCANHLKLHFCKCQKWSLTLSLNRSRLRSSFRSWFGLTLVWVAQQFPHFTLFFRPVPMLAKQPFKGNYHHKCTRHRNSYTDFMMLYSAWNKTPSPLNNGLTVKYVCGHNYFWIFFGSHGILSFPGCSYSTSLRGTCVWRWFKMENTKTCTSRRERWAFCIFY